MTPHSRAAGEAQARDVRERPLLHGMLQAGADFAAAVPLPEGKSAAGLAVLSKKQKMQECYK